MCNAYFVQPKKGAAGRAQEVAKEVERLKIALIR